MVWNASGEARVKSYRIYQELESKYNEAVAMVAELQKAIAFKDGLVRSLAAEVAMLPKAPTTRDLQHLMEEASTAAERTISGTRPAARPGVYSSVDGTAEDDGPVRLVPPPADGLGHIPSPPKRKKA